MLPSGCSTLCVIWPKLEPTHFAWEACLPERRISFRGGHPPASAGSSACQTRQGGAFLFRKGSDVWTN